MAAIWMVRHAPTTLAGVCYGQSDVAVTLEPADAAQAIAERWPEQATGVTAEIWTSPWARTRPVAARLAAGLHAPCRVDARLSELSFGVWEGRTFADIEQTDSARFNRWMQAYELEAPPGGETAAQLRARVAHWLDERRASPATVLAVTHAGVIRMARAIAGGLAYSEVAGQAVPHLSPERVR